MVMRDAITLHHFDMLVQFLWTIIRWVFTVSRFTVIPLRIFSIIVNSRSAPRPKAIVVATTMVDIVPEDTTGFKTRFQNISLVDMALLGDCKQTK